MKLTEVEKQEIEKEAREYGLHGIAGAHSTHLNQRIQSFKDGATAMAEKKNETIASHERDINNLKNLSLRLEAELSRLKEVAAKMVPILEKFLNGVRLHGVQTQIYTEGNKALIEYQALLEGEKK